jgi:hypothetical protein
VQRLASIGSVAVAVLACTSKPPDRLAHPVARSHLVLRGYAMSASAERPDVRGWCAAEAGDADAALDHLAHVRGSVVPDLAAAIPFDVPFILAARDGKAAESLLQTHGMDTVQVLDNLAAAYVEVGRDDDAVIINRRAIEFAGRTIDAAYCHRATKDVLLGHADLEALVAATQASSDATCRELIHALQCAIARRCEDYSLDRSGNIRAALLVAAYDSWPGVPADYRTWRELVYRVDLARQLEAAVQLGRAALPAMMRASTCTVEQVAEMRDHAVHLDIPELRELTVELCNRIAQLSPEETIAHMRRDGHVVVSTTPSQQRAPRHTAHENHLPEPAPRSVAPDELERLRVRLGGPVRPDTATERGMIEDGVRRVAASFKTCVDEWGGVMYVALLKSSGYRDYDAEIEDDIWNWQYVPYEVNGRRVPVCSATTRIYSH